MTDKEKIVDAVENMLTRLTPSNDFKIEHYKLLIEIIIRTIVNAKREAEMNRDSFKEDKQFIHAVLHEGAVVAIERILYQISLEDELEPIVQKIKENVYED